MKEEPEEKIKTYKPRILSKEIYPLACTCNQLVQILQPIQDTLKTKKLEPSNFQGLNKDLFHDSSRFFKPDPSKPLRSYLLSCL